MIFGTSFQVGKKEKRKPKIDIMRIKHLDSITFIKFKNEYRYICASIVLLWLLLYLIIREFPSRCKKTGKYKRIS